MSNNIDWDAFNSKYWKPEPGRQYQLVLGAWRMEEKTFGSENTPMKYLTFDVLKVDGAEQVPPKMWSTRNSKLAREFRTMIEAAERRGHAAIQVIIKRDLEKQNDYTVIDMSPRV